MVKSKLFLVFLITIAIIVLVGMWLLQARSNESRDHHVHASSNENIIAIESFQVTASKARLDTAVEGTLFAKGEEGIIESLQIVASMKLDPLDWGGISFHLPANLKISSMKSSFVLEKAVEKLPGENYVHTWTTVDPDAKWPTRVEIAKSDNYIPLGAGSGTIVIDLLPLERFDYEQSDITFAVSVGSRNNNGIKVVETDSIEVSIRGIDYEEPM